MGGVVSNYRYALNPEDFRHAWANAYQQAILQLGEMHSRADEQLDASRSLYFKIIEQNEKELQRWKKLKIESNLALTRIEEMGRKSEILINLATEKLIAAAKYSLESDAKQRQLERDIQRKISIEKNSFNIKQNEFRSKSLLKRILIACKNNL